MWDKKYQKILKEIQPEIEELVGSREFTMTAKQITAMTDLAQ